MTFKVTGAVLGILLSGLAGYLIALWQFNMEKEKDKINLYVETKAICDQLQSEYAQLIDGKFELSFYGVMLTNSMATRTYSYYDKNFEWFLERSQSEGEENKSKVNIYREKIEVCLKRIEVQRKELSKKLDMIQFYFDIDKELSDEMIPLRVSKFSDDLAFQKGTFSDIQNHDELKKRKEIFKKQGNEYLQKWYIRHSDKLLKRLKDQIDI